MEFVFFVQVLLYYSESEFLLYSVPVSQYNAGILTLIYHTT